ncbi:hypothetical protein JW824_01360 [bacterium]|nr:hypothetical protein [bacterium]RQV98551.1 MAG: hypothetical protein EH221_01750 [bacterium]
MMKPFLEKIFIDENVTHDKLTQSILEKCKGIPCKIVKKDELESVLSPISLSQGKRILLITEQKGGLVKPCPGTLPPYLCCRYTVINQMMQCPVDCTYCILQCVIDQPTISLYINLPDIFKSVDRLLSEQRGRLFRFGTGESTDSLALDDVTGISSPLIQYFSQKRNTLIEFKTKTTCIDRLLESFDPHVVVSWSLNPQTIAGTEELHADRVVDRLRAAQQCQEKGFLLGFHFDPILHVDHWESLYRELIQKIFSYIDGSRIAWISLGSLRYPPILKGIIQKRFPKSRIVYEEMIRGLDGKMRYPKPLRVEMYGKIYSWLKEQHDDLFIYFCMESSDVWDRVMGKHPENNEELDYWFAQSLWKRFPDLDMDEPKRSDYIFLGITK